MLLRFRHYMLHDSKASRTSLIMRAVKFAYGIRDNVVGAPGVRVSIESINALILFAIIIHFPLTYVVNKTICTTAAFKSH